MPKIGLKPRARQDLNDIWHYTAQKSGDLDTADNFLERVERKLEMLARQPFMGHLRNELHPGLRSFAVGRYLIFYLPMNDGIGVVRVLYGGRDFETIDFDED